MSYPSDDKQINFEQLKPAQTHWAIAPLREMGAYEALWAKRGMTLKRLSDLFEQHPGALPSDFVPPAEAEEFKKVVLQMLAEKGVHSFGVRIHGAGEYPAKLRDASHPVELLYFRGSWDIVESPSVAVVGTREPTPEGIRRTRKLVQNLVADGFTITSGLAKGVDRVAHETAIKEGGWTIAVIGTPIHHAYPPENARLQEYIAKNFLLVSQVPAFRYSQQTWKQNRFFFPERNVTMSALTEGTVIVEASDTSGTLTQARAALAQGRKLFILESCFKNKDITWPARFEKLGAIRVVEYDDIRRHLTPAID